MNRPVVKTTIASENLTSVDLAEASFWLPKLFSEPMTLQSTLYILIVNSYMKHFPCFVQC